MNKKIIKTISIEALRAELSARSKLGQGLEKTISRVSSILEPRPDFKQYSSNDIVEEIKVRQKVIYDDDRQEIFEISDYDIIKNSEAVAAIFSVNDILDNNDGTVSLPAKTLGEEFKEKGVPLCPNEPFKDQPAGAFCTAFLVREDILITAGHCLNDDNLHTRRFVFGYEVNNYGQAVTEVPVNNIYMGVELLGWQLDNGGPDWAVVRLDRNVEDIKPLKIRIAGKIEDYSAVYVIGHPSGLPKKYASKAEVRDNRNQSFFVANLDTYGGNSGSPVFNSESHEVEGILVRGETDFAENENCMVSLVCPVQGCRGEDCTRITIPNIPGNNSE